jgi:hypothetical protein
MLCLHYLVLFLLLLLFLSLLCRVLSLSFMLLLPPQRLLLLVLCVFGSESLFLLQVVERWLTSTHKRQQPMSHAILPPVSRLLHASIICALASRLFLPVCARENMNRRNEICFPRLLMSVQCVQCSARARARNLQRIANSLLLQILLLLFPLGLL